MDTAARQNPTRIHLMSHARPVCMQTECTLNSWVKPVERTVRPASSRPATERAIWKKEYQKRYSVKMKRLHVIVFALLIVNISISSAIENKVKGAVKNTTSPTVNLNDRFALTASCPSGHVRVGGWCVQSGALS
ncbi:hypothetical protein EVAR_79499_1 [Eumeta japonica]|uniref:Uncharacterized protein n=1 Tax=Eumeta variegata TaxID=151549 RepID=A0A4C1UEN8_EUMVA|nr:hypothetical protein EVAR_79499_1 [Eumeta japonica]